jgi:prepilin-type N-terminal cleavage/methylation domain-containing protein
MKLKVGEKGFTLIELVVGIAIASLVVSAASMTVITMMRLSPQSSNWAISLRQVQDAGYWISRDVQMSDNLTIGTGNPTFLTFSIPIGPTDNTTVVYEFEDMPDSLKRLTRNDLTAGQQSIVAEYISIPTPPYYNSDNRTLTFTITATYGDVPVTKQYEAMQRVP